MWKEAVVAYFKALSRRLSGETDENHEELESGERVSWQTLEQHSFWTLVRTLSPEPACSDIILFSLWDGSDVILGTLFSNALYSCSCLWMKGQFSRPYKTIILSYLQGLANKFRDSFLIPHRAFWRRCYVDIRWRNKTELTWKVWISCVQYSLNSSSLGHCASSTLSRCEVGAYDGRESECEISC
jgi:hypothetical protein